MKIEFLSRKLWFMRLLTFLARRSAAKAAAFLISRRIRELETGAVPVTGAFRVLGLSKGGFNEDILAALGGRAELRLFQAQRTDLQALFRGLVPDAVGDYTYMGQPPEVEAAKLRYRAFLVRLWDELERRGHRFDAVLTGNHVYYAERELSVMLEARSIPFVVLHKEGLKTSGNAAHFVEYYRDRVGPFMGRRVLVYNETEKQIQIESGIVSPAQVEVVGMARLDRYHHWRVAPQAATDPQRRKELLFFWFDPHTGIHTPELFLNGQPDTSAHSWIRLWKAVLSELRLLAIRAPHLRIRIKTKGRADRGAGVRQALELLGPLPTNVEIITGGDPFELITQSDFITGLQSTTIFESIAAGKPVLVPRFAEAADPEMQPFLLDFGGAVDYAESAESFARTLTEWGHGEHPVSVWNPARVATLDGWYGNPDGQSAERIWQALQKELNAGPGSSINHRTAP